MLLHCETLQMLLRCIYYTYVQYYDYESEQDKAKQRHLVLLNGTQSTLNELCENVLHDPMYYMVPYNMDLCC
jgi:hypothetical protein